VNLASCVENPEPGGFRILKMSKLFSLKHKNSNLRAQKYVKQKSLKSKNSAVVSHYNTDPQWWRKY